MFQALPGTDTSSNHPLDTPAPLPIEEAKDNLKGSGGAQRRKRGFFSGKKKEVKRRFLAVAPELENMAVLLECVYTAHLLHKKHRNFTTAIIVHPSNRGLVRQLGGFDEIIPFELPLGEREGSESVNQSGSQSSSSRKSETKSKKSKTLRSTIMAYKPDVLYSPDPSVKHRLSTLLTGAHIKIGGARIRLVARLLNLFRADNDEDLARLKKRKGLDLFPELISLPGDLRLDGPVHNLPGENFIWLSLFDNHDMAGAWPVGYAARLSRLLAPLHFPVVVPLPLNPGENMLKEVEFLKRNAPGIIFLENSVPTSRVSGMRRAAVVVGPAGPETLLATMMKKSVVVLHDMSSYRSQSDPLSSLASIRGGLSLVGENSPAKEGDTRRQTNKAMELKNRLYFKMVDTLQRHIKPSVDECINDCPSCSFNSCMEYISPERVFENLKKILLPF